MAYLGREGVIQLRRTAPDPIVVPTTAVNTTSHYVTVDFDDWFLGEEVTLIHSSGNISGFIHRDILDRLYFHTSRDGALTNSVDTRVSLNAVSLAKPIVIAAAANAAQLGTLATFQSSLSSQVFEKRLRGWPTVATTYRSQASMSPWRLQGELRSWQLSRSAPEIDTGSIGDKFSTLIKSTISGSGSIDFVVNLYARDNYTDVDPLLRLVQLTEQGSTATCKFYLKKATSGGTRTDNWGTTVETKSALFFYATIMLTNCTVNVSAVDIVAASANFVTTGPIRLLSE